MACLQMALHHRDGHTPPLPHLPAPGRGGHLVLVIGYDGQGLHFRNPSGHTPAARSAVLPEVDFERFFAGRGVSLRL